MSPTLMWRARSCAIGIAAVLIVAAPPARAQTIGGRVLDVRTHLPAQLVDVHVIGSDGVVLAESTTDSAGVFYALLSAAARVRLHFDIGGVASFDTDTMTVGAEQFVQREFLIDVPRVFAEIEVEKQVSQIPGTGNLRYPDDLKKRNIEGEVLAQFVVDTTGRAIMGTFRALGFAEPGFIAAVRTGLATMRFYPAEVSGRKVIQLVQQPFTFHLTGRLPQPADEGPAFPDPFIPRGRPRP